jgi:hypothetical protein
MSEAVLVVSDADNGLRAHLDEEINAFNAAATGHADGRLQGSGVFRTWKLLLRYVLNSADAHGLWARARHGDHVGL